MRSPWARATWKPVADREIVCNDCQMIHNWFVFRENGCDTGPLAPRMPVGRTWLKGKWDRDLEWFVLDE